MLSRIISTLVAFALIYSFLTNPTEEQFANELSTVLDQNAVLASIGGNTKTLEFALKNALSGNNLAAGGFKRTNFLLGSYYEITIPGMEGKYLGIWGKLYPM